MRNKENNFNEKDKKYLFLFRNFIENLLIIRFLLKIFGIFEFQSWKLFKS